MATFKRFEDIDAWQRARILCQKIHQIIFTTDLYKDFKLKEQVNSSSGSIMDNIAEGFGRGGNSEFLHFLEIAHASGCETQSQLYRILDRNYISQEVFQELYALTEEIKSKLIGLIKYLNASVLKGPKFASRNPIDPKP